MVEMVGMRDVAKKAGVSLSTVSLVVNGNGYVSDQMRAKVEAAMRALDYIPNELARNLYHGRTNIVGVIVPTIRHPFFSTLTAFLQRAFAKKGLRTMLCSTADAQDGESEYVDMLRRHMMDGIVAASHSRHDFDYWASVQRPIVAFDRFLGENIPSVGSDHELGGRLVADALIRTGVRHVVLIGGPRDQFHDVVEDATISRLDEDVVVDALSDTTFPTVRYHVTLEQALDEAGVRHDYVEAGEVADMEGYVAAARTVFDRFPDADAVVSADLGAACCVQEALRRGLSVPRDVQIIAYDGTYVADAAGMRLTSVQQDFAGLATAIADCMADAIERPDNEEEPIEVSPDRLIGSVGKLVPVSMRLGETTRIVG